MIDERLESVRDALVDNLPSDQNCVEVHTLDSGECSFNYYQFLRMKRDIEGNGNFYILLAGFRVDSDISLWEFYSETETKLSIFKKQITKKTLPSDILAEHHTLRFYDKRINPDYAYLIAYDTIPQKASDITVKLVADKLTNQKTCTKFDRSK